MCPKHQVEDLFIGEQVDTLLWLFDLFLCNENTLLDIPLKSRRQVPVTFSVNLRLRIFPVQKVDPTDKPPSLLRDFQNRENGGLIIKDATKRYDPLSFQTSWYSLKLAVSLFPALIRNFIHCKPSRSNKSRCSKEDSKFRSLNLMRMQNTCSLRISFYRFSPPVQSQSTRTRSRKTQRPNCQRKLFGPNASFLTQEKLPTDST